MDFQYSRRSAEPYHQFTPVPSLTSSHSSSDEFATSPPENLNDQFPTYTYSQYFSTNPSQPTNCFRGPPPPPSQNNFSAEHVRYQQQYGACRKQKEQNIKDLKAKLADLKATQQQISVENKRLKRELQRVSTDNKILRTTSQIDGIPRSSISIEPATNLIHFNSSEFDYNILQNQANKSASHRIVTSNDGERRLASSAAWDFIINHELFKKGLVDVGDVSERLKHRTYCNGQGPVFLERFIISAIEQSVMSKTDNLL